MDKICFVVNGYPTKDDPVYAFIRPVVEQMTDKGISCTVIATQSVTNSISSKKKLRPTMWVDHTTKKNKITVYQPKFMSFSNLKINGEKLSSLNRDKAVRSILKQLSFKPDVIYCHFWDCLVPVCGYAEKENIPVIVVSGESKIEILDNYKKEKVVSCLKYVKGVIFVSSKNKEESLELKLINSNSNTVILPNGYNEKDFHVISKMVVRNELGLNKDDVIAIFVGDNSNRKGSERVVAAAERVPGLKLILVGAGENIPESSNILFKGKVPHKELATYLCASDFFVLPTLAEGCCNAIIEAMACGLPIVSSNLSFNDDILDDTCSLRINPNSVDEIAGALKQMHSSVELREKLSKGSLEKASDLKIEKRVERMISFIDKAMKEE